MEKIYSNLDKEETKPQIKYKAPDKMTMKQSYLSSSLRRDWRGFKLMNQIMEKTVEMS